MLICLSEDFFFSDHDVESPGPWVGSISWKPRMSTWDFAPDFVSFRPASTSLSYRLSSRFAR